MSGHPGAVLGILVAMALALAPASACGQAVVGLEKGTKVTADQLGASLDRLRDGWSTAAVTAGMQASPAMRAELVVRMLHEPLKLAGPAAFEGSDGQLLKSAVLRAETLVRTAAARLERGELDAVSAESQVQAGLDEYLAVLMARLGRAGRPSAGAVDR